MKKQAPKTLTLNKETLRHLGRGELRSIEGAAATSGDPISDWCNTSCRCTSWCQIDETL